MHKQREQNKATNGQIPTLYREKEKLFNWKRDVGRPSCRRAQLLFLMLFHT